MPKTPKKVISGKNDRDICPHHRYCSGCQLWEIPWSKQKDLKLENLKNYLNQYDLKPQTPVQSVEIAPFGLRDRLDFTLDHEKLGLFNNSDKTIQDLPECWQLSPALQNWLTEFRKFKWPFNKASFRLRVSPGRHQGLWIDAANIDIKTLLEEKNLLLELQKYCFIEIGQRRKVPKWHQGRFQLGEPEAHPWFKTWLDEQTPLELFCQVASFTQPSFAANKVITGVIRNWLKQSSPGKVLEFGSGIGNLTFPAAASAHFVTACEVDSLALQGLQKTLQSLPEEWLHLKEKIEIFPGDFQRKLKTDFSEYSAVLVNPPRSGLMGFLDPLEQLEKTCRPKSFVYMSCFPESLCLDLVRLANLGYQIKEMLVVDQFPQSTHYEVLCRLQK